MTEVIEHPEFTIYTDHDIYYVPFVANDGRAGYRVGYAVAADGPDGEKASRETFVYFNPSDSIDVYADPDVFVYVGGDNDPALDEPIVFVALGEEAWT